jgi:hypothetical protein
VLRHSWLRDFEEIGDGCGAERALVKEGQRLETTWITNSEGDLLGFWAHRISDLFLKHIYKLQLIY